MLWFLEVNIRIFSKMNMWMCVNFGIYEIFVFHSLFLRVSFVPSSFLCPESFSPAHFFEYFLFRNEMTSMFNILDELRRHPNNASCKMHYQKNVCLSIRLPFLWCDFSFFSSVSTYKIEWNFSRSQCQLCAALFANTTQKADCKSYLLFFWIISFHVVILIKHYEIPHSVWVSESIEWP